MASAVQREVIPQVNEMLRQALEEERSYIVREFRNLVNNSNSGPGHDTLFARRIIASRSSTTGAGDTCSAESRLCECTSLHQYPSHLQCHTTG